MTVLCCAGGCFCGKLCSVLFCSVYALLRCSYLRPAPRDRRLRPSAHLLLPLLLLRRLLLRLLLLLRRLLLRRRLLLLRLLLILRVPARSGLLRPRASAGQPRGVYPSRTAGPP